MLVWKEVARPGTYWYTNQEGKPARLDATPDLIKHWHEQGNAMLAAGLSIPVPVEHQKEATPLTSSERAARQLLNNAGWVDQYRLRPGNRLYAALDIQDESLVKKLPKTIRFTSPWINSFTDGNGKSWDGVITHLALTSRPRITKQEPFQNERAALSLAQPASPAQQGTLKGVAFSLAGLMDRELGLPGIRPHFPMAFSILSGIKLAEDYDGEEEKEKKPPPKKDGSPNPEKEASPREKPPSQPDKDSPPGMMHEEELELVDVLCEMASALWGIELPEDTDEHNLMQRLMRAMLDKMKMDGGNMPEASEMEEMDEMATEKTPTNPATSPVVQEQPPIYMSLEQVNAMPEGEMKKMAQAMLSLQNTLLAQATQTDSLKKHAFDQALAVRNVRIDRLAKKTGRDSYKERLLAQTTNIQLSLDASGKVIDPFSATLDLLEEGIKDLPSLLKSPAGAVEMDHPDPAETSEKRRQEIVAELMKNGGLLRTTA